MNRGEKAGNSTERVIFLAACLLCAVLAASCRLSARGRPPQARAGVLDLSSWDFKEDGTLPLRGEWRFSTLGEDGRPSGGETLRSVPDLWSGKDGGSGSGMGYAMYRLRVLLPAGRARLAIRNMTIATSFSLYANGALVDEAGRPGPGPASSKAAYDPGAAPIGEVEGTLDIEVRVSNWEYRSGGMWRALTLGDEARVFSDKRYSDLAAMVLLAALAAVGLNALVHFAFRRKDHSYLYFGLFVLSVAFRILVTGEYLIQEIAKGISFGIIIRLEYFAAMATPALFVLYYGTFYPFALQRPRRLALAAPSALFLLVLPFLPLPLLTRLIYPIYAVLAVQVGSIVYIHFRKVIPLKRWEGAAIAAGGIVFIACLVNDILYESFLLPTVEMLPFGLAAFVFMQAVVQARRTDAAYLAAEVLATELGEANSLLQTQLAANDEARKRLEALVSEKDLLIREVNHRVKNSLQVVSSIISLQEKRAEEGREREALTALGARIRSIGLVHEMLYGSVSSDRIDLASFLRELAGLLERSYGSEARPIAIETGIGKLLAPVDFCVDIGLVLNELVSNACKHGQEKGGCPRISIAVRASTENVFLEIADDGKGFPEGFDPEAAKGLGFTVTRALVRRRGGTVTCRNDSATGGAVIEVSMELDRNGTRGPSEGR